MNTDSELIDGLLAVDRLNSWLRYLPEGRFFQTPLQSNLRKIVYWVKKNAILAAHQRLPIEYNRSKVVKECRACNGTGTWHHPCADSDDAGDSCRKCQGTGTALLLFVETTISGVEPSIRWHTPQHDWFFGSLDTYTGKPENWCDYPNATHYTLATNWDVNKPGKPLTNEEVRRDFLTLYRVFRKDVEFIMECDHQLKFHNTGFTQREVAAWFDGILNRQNEFMKSNSQLTQGVMARACYAHG